MTLRSRLFSWSFELDRAARVLAILREELAFRTLTERDWLDLGQSLYTQEPKYSQGSDHNQSGLFAFEREAIELAFPPPPAAILVGGCGGGREIFGLLERGYRIAAAYDPVKEFIDALREDPRLFEMRERLCVGAHQTVDSLAPVRKLCETGAPVDAVLVGWTSYTHVRGAKRRVEFLRSVRALCPSGPLLLSFHAAMADESERPARLRTRLRRVLGTSRSMAETGDGLQRGQGAVHRFTEAAFAEEAIAAGYRVRLWQEHDFGAAHAILIPETHTEAP
ncbi:MAG TPA: hypothetical protein VER96_33605 [Polyangiaceae bacterium]|nr:hypothetical protein [Polyangiaceae bacterium]